MTLVPALPVVTCITGVLISGVSSTTFDEEDEDEDDEDECLEEVVDCCLTSKKQSCGFASESFLADVVPQQSKVPSGLEK